MIVVADTSPINYLILIGQIDVLGKLYQHVLIPSAVYTELASPHAPRIVRQWTRQPPAWLEVRCVRALETTVMELDLGETEAIQLAVETGAEQIIVDDLRGRREAARQGLDVIGTLGVLREAALLGLLDIHLAVHELQNTTFKIAPDLLEELLRQFR